MKRRPFVRASPEVIERAAGQLLSRNDIGKPPVDIDWIAEREGLRFEYMDLDAVSGGYIRETDRTGVAFIAKREIRQRQRFSKAHELAHHLFDEPEIAIAAGYAALRLPTGYRGRERHWAHELFAAALLMPRAWIAEIVRHDYDVRPLLIEKIARGFDVSPSAAEVRLVELGHIEREARK